MTLAEYKYQILDLGADRGLIKSPSPKDMEIIALRRATFTKSNTPSTTNPGIPQELMPRRHHNQGPGTRVNGCKYSGYKKLSMS